METQDHLLDLLQTEDTEQGRAAAEALGRIGPAAIQPLLQILGKEGVSPWWAIWAVEALTHVGLPAVNPLLDLLEEGDPRTGANAIDALGRIGDRRSVVPLLRFLQSDDPVLRQHSAAALGKVGDERAIGPLMDRLTDPDPNVAHDVNEALIAMGEPAVLPLIAVLEDRDRATVERARAASLLGKLRDGRAFAPLATALLDTTEVSAIRRSAITGLSELDSQRALDPLTRVIVRRHEEPKTRVWAVQSIRDRRAFPMLLDILRDSEDDSTVRAAAAGQLCALGGQQAVGPLVVALDDTNAAVRYAAVSALGLCGDERVLPVLRQVEERGDGALEWGARKSRIAIARRFSLPFAPGDDPAGQLVARYGPVLLYEVKEDRKPMIRGRMLYLIRINDPEGSVDLDTLALVIPTDQENILTYLRRVLERLGNDATYLVQHVQEAQDPVDKARERERLVKIERQGRALEHAMHELEV